MKLAELGEFGFIERIRAAARSEASVRCGIGDDCAAVTVPAGHLLLTTTDLLIEGVHFQLAWSDMRTLGRKSVTVNVSDVAAMGGQPRHLYLGLGIPAAMEVADLEQFIEGFLEAAREYDTVLIGGDTCRSSGPLLISVTAEGSVAPEQMVRRAGARAGDVLVVSGTLGDSALALRHLAAGRPQQPMLAARHHDPTARVALGRALAETGLATAMIDVSDGLLADLGHILTASGVGAVVREACLPLSKPFRQALAGDPSLLDLALAGGEDYELLFSVPVERCKALAELSARVGVPLTRIGTVEPSHRGLLIQDAAGHCRKASASGFNHFRHGSG